MPLSKFGFLLVLALAVFLTSVPMVWAASDGSGTIAGRVIDATTNRPIPGSVVIALEAQPGNGSIVNATSADAQGRFSFTRVQPGNYALVISAMDNQNRSYQPVLIVGKSVVPGANMGTIPLKPGNGWANVNVPVESNTPITITLTLDQNIGKHVFALPWPDGTPTFDTRTQQGCKSASACTTDKVKIPSASVLMAEFNGKAIQYLPSPVKFSYTVSANAYRQYGAKPTCDSHMSAPQRVTLSASQAMIPRPIVFTGCE